jgi:hypothetical protein
VLVKDGSTLLELLQLGVVQLSKEPTLDSQLTEGQLEQPLGLVLAHQLDTLALRLARSVLRAPEQRLLLLLKHPHY